MKAVTYDYARSNFDEMFHLLDVENDGVVIVKDKKNFVLVNKDFLDSVYETIELSKYKEFVTSLRIAKEEIEKGESFTFEDVFGEEI